MTDAALLFRAMTGPRDPADATSIGWDSAGELDLLYMAPERLNALVISGFAGVALLIAGVGIAGVLMFTASARTREFGVRVAMGATRRDIVMRVLRDGALIVAIGILAGAAGGYAFLRLAGNVVGDVSLPGALPLLGAAAILLAAGILASLVPAARASHVDVVEALGSD